MSVVASQPTDMGCSESSDHPSKGIATINIFQATQLGDLNSCKQIIEEQGPQILYGYDQKGHTPLHWACLAGYNDIVKYFIECNAPVQKGSNNELAPKPIHWACVNGHIVTVDILIQNGASIDVTDNRNCTPLIIAAQYGKTMLAGYLIGKGARKDLTDIDGDNALHWAAFKGYSELVQLLLYSGFNARQRDDLSQTALHLACLSGNLPTVKLLVEQDVELNMPDNNGKTPYDLAMGRGYKAIFQLLERKNRMESIFGIWKRLLGPLVGEKKYLFFFLFCLVFFSYPMYLYHFSYLWEADRHINLLFLIMNVIMWYTFVKSAKADPGFLPCNADEYDLALKKVAVHKEWEVNTSDNPLSKLCHTCRLLRPIRSKHCRICNRCVKEMDHHCHFIHNCIGPNNRVIFLVFFLITMLSSYIAIYMMRLVTKEFGYTFLRTVLVLLYGCFAPIFTYVLLVMIGQISLNLTTNERWNILRYSYLRDKQTGLYRNPFDRGVVKNWLEFLHVIPSQQNLHSDHIV